MNANRVGSTFESSVFKSINTAFHRARIFLDGRILALGVQRRNCKFGITLTLILGLSSCAHPIFEGIDTTTSSGAMSINLSVPPSTRGAGAGDLLVAVVGVRGNPATSFPAGWTAVAGHAGFNEATCSSDDEGIACQLSVYWKFSDGTESSVNVFLNAGNVSQAAGAVFRYSHTHPVNPIGQVSTNPGSSNNPTAPNLVTNQDDQRVIQIVVSDTQGGSFPQLPLTAEPANAKFNLQSATPLVRNSIVMGGAEFRRGSSGSNTGSGVWTGGENNWRGTTLTIRSDQSTGVVISAVSNP